MDRRELFAQISETYERHVWRVARVLVTDGGREELSAQLSQDVAGVDAGIDAVWFARPSHASREAWELRLMSEQAYALFEAFEADETEEDREEARQEMEHKMRDYAGR